MGVCFNKVPLCVKLLERMRLGQEAKEEGGAWEAEGEAGCGDARRERSQGLEALGLNHAQRLLS